MFVTDGGLFDVVANGTNLLVGADAIEEMHVIEHVHSNKPSLQLRYVDNKLGVAGRGLFQDGIDVLLSLGDGRRNSTPLQYKFRQYGLDELAPKGAGDLIDLAGVADLVPYMTSTMKGAMVGTASEAITQLARKFKVPLLDIDATQDKMTWVSDNRTVAQWIRNVVDHAWMGEGKSPIKAMTSVGGEWMLRVKDIMAPMSGAQGAGSKQLVSMGLPGAGSQGMLTSFDHMIKTHGGAMGSFANYGLKQVTNDLSGAVQDLLGIDINALSQFIGINSGLRDAVGIARTLFAAASHGNTHDKYHQARHANTKVRASFTTEIRTLIHEQSGLKLLDSIPCTFITAMGTIDQAYSGWYRVSGITRSMRRGNYTEMLTLVSPGTSAME